VRHPRAATVLGPLGIGTPLVLLLLVAAGPGVAPGVVPGAVAVWGAAMASLPAVLQTRVLAVAPFDVAVASAGYVTAFNAAIGAGALIGSVLLDTAGVVALTATAAALALLAVPLAAASTPRRRGGGAGG
jgi:predicted MFS family arabinose efflux permease